MARPASVSARPLSFVIRTENFTAARVMNRLHELFSAGTHTRWHSLMGSGPSNSSDPPVRPMVRAATSSAGKSEPSVMALKSKSGNRGETASSDNPFLTVVRPSLAIQYIRLVSFAVTLKFSSWYNSTAALRSRKRLCSTLPLGRTTIMRSVRIFSLSFAAAV